MRPSRRQFLAIAGLTAARRAFGQLPNIYHFGWSGQSLAVGTHPSSYPVGAPDYLTTSQPAGYNNYTLSGATELGSSLAALVATTWGREAPAFAAGAQFTAMSGGTSPQSLVTMHGAGSTGYTGLQRSPSSPSLPITGTTPYVNGQTQFTNAKAAVLAAGLNTYRLRGVSITHGETDSTNGVNASTYQGYLEQWLADYAYDALGFDSTSSGMPLFVDQLSVAFNSVVTTGKPNIGQWLAAKANPGRIILVCPKYGHADLPYADLDGSLIGSVFNGDGTHLLPQGYRYLGEQHGKVWYQTIIQGRRWVPLAPRSITRSGAVVTCRFWVPVGNLVIDTTRFPDITSNNRKYGFEYWSHNGVSLANRAISSVTVSGDTATITLSADPGSPSEEYLGYGVTATNTVGTSNSQANTTRVGGNIHDEDTTVGVLSGKTLHNWSVQFFEAIGFSWDPYITIKLFPLPNSLVR